VPAGTGFDLGDLKVNNWFNSPIVSSDSARYFAAHQSTRQQIGFSESYKITPCSFVGADLLEDGETRDCVNLSEIFPV